MKRILRISIVLVWFITSSFAQHSSEYVIIANKQVHGASINSAQLKGIYLREVRTWGNGSDIVV